MLCWKPIGGGAEERPGFGLGSSTSWPVIGQRRVSTVCGKPQCLHRMNRCDIEPAQHATRRRGEASDRPRACAHHDPGDCYAARTLASEPTLRRALVEGARVLYERGHNAPVDGNLSARLGERYLLCTPSGVHKGRLEPADIVKLARDPRAPSGVRAVEPAQRPSSELRMHLAIYEARPDVGAIAHAHSPHTVALTVAGHGLEHPVVPEAILAFDTIPTVPYASPTTADVPAAVLQHARSLDAFVLERHGPVCLGRSVEEAVARLEVVEHTAHITWLALAAGAASPIAPDEVERLRRIAKDLAAATAAASRPRSR